MQQLPTAKENKSFYSDSLILFLVRFFSNIATLAVMIYFSHNLLKDDYGKFQNFWVYLSVLGTIATAGISILSFTYSSSTLLRLASQIRWRYYLGYSSFILIVAVAFCVLVYLKGYAHASQSLILLVFFVGYVLNVLLEAFLINLKRFRFLLTSSILYSAFFVSIHLYVVHGGFDFYRLISYLSILIITRLLLNVLVCRNAIQLVNVAEAIPVHLKRLKSTWLHLFAFESSQIFVRFLDKLIVSFIVSKELSAVYFNGTVDIPFLPILLAAVSNAGSLYLTKNQRNDKPLHKQIIRDSSSVMATASFAIFAYLYFFRQEFVTVIFSEKYLASIPIFAIALLKLLPNVFTLPFYLQYKQRASLINKGAIIDVAITLVLLYPLYLLLGLPGVILSFALSSFVQGAYYTYCAASLLKVSPFSLLPVKNWVVKMVVFATVAFTAHHLLSNLLTEKPRLFIGMLIIGTVSATWLLYEYKKSKLLNFAA